MFVIQRVLEVDGKLTLLIATRQAPKPKFPDFSPQQILSALEIQPVFIMVQQINQGQMDRWSIVSTLNYFHEDEVNIVTAKLLQFADKDGSEKVAAMVRMADLTRKGFMSGDLSTVMSPAQ